MIIKCPECGHQVSDKAPVCPSCGVEIAGHIVQCAYCSELYLKEEASCPCCHHTDNTTVAPKTNVGNAHHSLANESNTNEPIILLSDEAESTIQDGTLVSTNETADDATFSRQTPSNESETIHANFVVDDNAVVAEAVVEGEEENNRQKKNNHLSLAVSLLIAVIIAAVLLFLYNQGVGVGKANSEQEAYEQALSSNEPAVLNNYLKENLSASKAHRDSISARLNSLMATTKSKEQADKDLSIALSSNSKEVLQQFLAKYPDSNYRHEFEAKIDEIDWGLAVAKDNEDAYLGYKAQHPNGVHGKEADEKLGKLLSTEDEKPTETTEVTDGEKTKAVAAVRQLLQGINSKSKDKIASAVAPSLNFLGASGATSKDIQRYMTDKLYQADVKTINWHLGSLAEIKKKGSDSDAELHVKIPATLDIERKGGKAKRNYVISATIKNGRITTINW